VAGGGTALDPEVVAQLLTWLARVEPIQELTPREREVLGLMAEGWSDKPQSRPAHRRAGRDL